VRFNDNPVEILFDFLSCSPTDMSYKLQWTGVCVYSYGFISSMVNRLGHGQWAVHH